MLSAAVKQQQNKQQQPNNKNSIKHIHVLFGIT